MNNSDQNATVKCSSGFYIQVARASLGTLNKRSVLSSCDIAMTVDQVTVTEDKTGLEATKLLSLSLMSDQKLLGGVKVHFHHSHFHYFSNFCPFYLVSHSETCGWS